MRIGLFDHVERADRPLADQYDERLKFAASADEAGFYCLHVAEHHCTPLNMVPEPGVYLAAVARATKRSHFGPLVYLLPPTPPLRLLEEICMLDHLGRGRLEVGVGRGVSPFELNYHKVDHGESRDIFFDAYDCLLEGLTHDSFSYKGKYFTYGETPMPMRPFQKPHPPLWYGSSNTIGSTWAGEHGLNFTANGPTDFAKGNIAAFHEALAKRGAPMIAKSEFKEGVAIGALRHIVVAETDDAARRIAKPAFEYHLASLNYLRKLHNSMEFTTRLNVQRGHNFEECVQNGMIVAGSPAMVTDALARQTREMGINYLLTYLFFGSMAFADAERSLELFATRVMPALAAL